MHLLLVRDTLSHDRETAFPAVLLRKRFGDSADALGRIRMLKGSKDVRNAPLY